MNLQASYFRIGNPMAALDRLFHPYSYSQEISVRDKPLRISLTGRAKSALKQRNKPLIAEMQIYFSCVVKKRVIFHDKLNLKTTSVSDKLQVCFHAVEARSCDPHEFAKNYPARRDLTSPAAMSMHPSILKIDYVDDLWVGEFEI